MSFSENSLLELRLPHGQSTNRISKNSATHTIFVPDGERLRICMVSMRDEVDDANEHQGKPGTLLQRQI